MKRTFQFLLLVGILYTAWRGQSHILRPISALNQRINLWRQAPVVQNQELENRLFNTELKIKLLEQDNKRLSAMLALKQKYDHVISANILSYNIAASIQGMWIDAGALSGIKVGDNVICDGALLGRVTWVQANEAWVELIWDGKSIVDVRMTTLSGEPTGARAMMQGNSLAMRKYFAELKYYTSEFNAKAGDVLLSTGLDNRFLSDVPVAVVEKKTSANEHEIYELKPLVQIDYLKPVLIVSM